MSPFLHPKAKRKPPLHTKTPSDDELKNPNTKREWENCKKAAEDADKSPELPEDAQHFYIRKGDTRDKDGKLRDRPYWAGDDEPYKTFGPFRNVGGGDVGQGDDIYIDVYKGVQ